MKEEVSYFKTQWFRVLVALCCLVMACVYTFQPQPEVLTVEVLDEVISNMLIASFYFSTCVIWLFMSFVSHNQARIELLEKKAEKYDALCEEVRALYEANRVNREHARLMELRINQIKYDMENQK